MYLLGSSPLKTAGENAKASSTVAYRSADTSEVSASVVAATHSFCLKIEPDFLDGLSDAERNGFFAVSRNTAAAIRW